MVRKTTLAGLMALALLAAAQPAQAQVIVQPAYPHRSYVIEFRQLTWSMASFTSAAEAQSFARRKANHGYEVVERLVPGQVQVSYRMPTWHTYAVVNHGSDAHNLARNLQAKGIEARVIH